MVVWPQVFGQKSILVTGLYGSKRCLSPWEMGGREGKETEGERKRGGKERERGEEKERRETTWVPPVQCASLWHGWGKYFPLKPQQSKFLEGHIYRGGFAWDWKMFLFFPFLLSQLRSQSWKLANLWCRVSRLCLLRHSGTLLCGVPTVCLWIILEPFIGGKLSCYCIGWGRTLILNFIFP